MDALEELRDLKANPLPVERDRIVEIQVDYTACTDDMVLSSVYEIDQQTAAMQAEIQRLQAQKTALMDRALRCNIRQDRFSELREIPGKKFRVLDAERLMKDWPQMCHEAAELEFRRAKEKIAKDGPTLKTLEAVCGKKRVDEYCSVKQAPGSYEVVPRGRF